MAHQEKCRHTACHCSAAEGQGGTAAAGYCSEACARGEMKAGKCGCGHPDCK